MLHLEKLLVKSFDFRTRDRWQNTMLQTSHMEKKKCMSGLLKQQRDNSKNERPEWQ